jgi:LysM repeat protein
LVEKYKFKKIVIILLFIFISISVADVFANDKTYSNIQYSSITVGAGDSVWSIAVHYCDKKDDIREFIYIIRKINGLNNNAEIFPGQILKIPIHLNN